MPGGVAPNPNKPEGRVTVRDHILGWLLVVIILGIILWISYGISLWICAAVFEQGCY